MEKIKYEMADFEGIESMVDFYKRLGISDRFSENDICNVTQIHMNREDCEALNDLIYASLKKSKRWRGFSDKYLRNAVAMDWLNYSPVSRPDIPPGEVFLFTEDEVEVAMSDYREWQENKKGDE